MKESLDGRGGLICNFANTFDEILEPPLKVAFSPYGTQAPVILRLVPLEIQTQIE